MTDFALSTSDAGRPQTKVLLISQGSGVTSSSFVGMCKSDTVVLPAHSKDPPNKTVIYVIQSTDFMDGVHNINIAQNAVSPINFRL